MNSVITFVIFATVLGMAGVNLSLPLLTNAGQTAAPGAVSGSGSILLLCLSVVGLGLVLAFKSK